jgi:WD40 repeat protein
MFFKSSPGAALTLFIGFFAHFIFAQTTPLAFKRGHEGELRTYTLSYSNKFVATAGTDHQLILWDYASGKQIREIQGQGEVISLVISPDDRYLFSADTACRVKKWDLRTGKMLFEFTAHGVFNPSNNDGGFVSEEIGHREDDEYLKEEYQKTKIKRADLLNPNIILSISADGRHLITGGRDTKIKIWDAGTGKLLNTFFEEDQSRIETVFLSKDMKFLISMDNSYEVIIRNYPTDKVITRFYTRSPINQNHLSRDQQYLLHLSEGDSLRKIQLSTGRVQFSKRLPHRLSRLVSVHDETQIIGLSWPDSIFYINPLKGEILSRHIDFTDGHDFSLDLGGQLLFLSGYGKKLSVGDPVKRTKIEKSGVYVPNIQKIEFSQSGNHLLINDAEVGLDLLNLSLMDKPQFVNIPLYDSWAQHYSQLSPNEKQLAVAAGEGNLWLWDLEKLSFQHAKADYAATPIAKANWGISRPIITDLSFSPDGRQIILADYIH